MQPTQIYKMLIRIVSDRYIMKFKLCVIIFLSFLSCTAKRNYLNTIDCSYWANDSLAEESQIQPRGMCAFFENGQIYACNSTLKRLQFSEKGLSAIYTIKYGWLFVKKDGSTIPTITFDNGADYFVENLARYTENGKIGFIDENGNIAIKAEYVFAFPFRNSYAIVCNGCTPVPYDEYSVLTGGTWGCIDKNGNIVLPMKYRKNEIMSEVEKL